MKNLKIFLIEDCQAEAADIVDQLNRQAEKRNDAEYVFGFEFLRGTVGNEDDEHIYYDESVIDRIEDCLKEAAGNEIGLLLDVLLTQKDIENTLASYYPQADLAKKIFFKFCDRIPVYMITGTPTFSTKSEVIMGTNLSGQFIAKNALLKYKLENDINKLFSFYKEYGSQTDNKHRREENYA